MHSSTQPTPAMRTREPVVIIDWTHVIPSKQQDQTHTNTDFAFPSSAQHPSGSSRLLDMVRSCLADSRVHVYLHRSIRDLEGHRLQNSLQALGCRVTTRVAASGKSVSFSWPFFGHWVE